MFMVPELTLGQIENGSNGGSGVGLWLICITFS